VTLRRGLSFGARRIGDSVRDKVPERLLPDPPTLGVVIGTYASVPYVHLQLEARQRLYPQIPLLVHDDHSHQQERLADLCKEYPGTEFESNSYRMPRNGLGDLTAFLGGALWAEDRKIDLLVKMSRRFIPLVPWTFGLVHLAQKSQGATYTHTDASYGLGFRSECVALHVATWRRLGLLDDIRDKCLTHDEQFVEGYMHGLAGRASTGLCQIHNQWADDHPEENQGFVSWNLLGAGRLAPDPQALWHDRDAPERYHAQAVSWGLPYSLADFQNPNAV